MLIFFTSLLTVPNCINCHILRSVFVFVFFFFIYFRTHTSTWVVLTVLQCCSSTLSWVKFPAWFIAPNLRQSADGLSQFKAVVIINHGTDCTPLVMRTFIKILPHSRLVRALLSVELYFFFFFLGCAAGTLHWSKEKLAWTTLMYFTKHISHNK